ncbi:MAG: peroxide stress protein YaaA [Flavobacteriaceae bacterium]
MKFVISPAKSLDFETPHPQVETTSLLFPKEAERIQKLMQKKSVKGLSKLMNISDVLAQLNWERYQQFAFPMQGPSAQPAVFVFNGDVYQGLEAHSLAADRWDTLQEKCRILSGLYGLLRPFDQIQAYRLEMGTALKVGVAPNLPAFWKGKITRQLNQELGAKDSLVNLASAEYFQAIDKKELKPQIITPEFRELRDGQLKMISFFAKKARGMMARFIVENDVQKPEDILAFQEDNYRFSTEHTKDPLKPVFIR